MRRALAMLPWLALAAGCAATAASGPTAPQTAAATLAEVRCPDASPAAFDTAAPACRGRLALELSRRAAAAHRWSESLEWGRRARAALEPALQGLADVRIAVARYAQGETAPAEAALRDALAFAAGDEAGELQYYLGEAALRRDAPADALRALAAALTAAPQAPWRAAAESLLVEAAQHPAMPREPGELAPELKALGTFVAAEADLRAGRVGDALKAYRALADDPELARLGLQTKVRGRVDDLSSRGTPVAGTLGAVLPLSGRLATFGVYTLRGVLLAFDPFAGERVLVLEDDRGEPFRSVRGMRALARQGAVAAVGPLVGKSAEAGVVTANALGLPTAVLSSAELPRLAPWAVRMAVTPRQQVDALLHEAMDLRGFRRFAILHPAEPFGVGMRDVFWDAVVARGGQVMAVDRYEPGSTDFKVAIRALVGADEFTPEELKARKAANQPLAHLDFDGIFIPDGAKTVGLILPQLLYFDVRGPVFFGPSTWNEPRLIELGREYAEGTFFVDWYWSGSESAVTRAFTAKYESVYGEARPPTVTAQGYEAAKLFAEPVMRDSRAAARNAAYGAEWASFSGRAKVLPDGEIARPLNVLTVMGKQIVPVEGSPPY